MRYYLKKLKSLSYFIFFPYITILYMSYSFSDEMHNETYKKNDIDLAQYCKEKLIEYKSIEINKFKAYQKFLKKFPECK